MFPSHTETTRFRAKWTARGGIVALAVWALAWGADPGIPAAAGQAAAAPDQTDRIFAPVGQGTVAIHSASSPSDVNVINPSPLPPGQSLDDSTLRDFIRHHGTTYTIKPDPWATPERWRGGRAATICPVITGLEPTDNDFVSARIRAVAAYVGAPVTTQSRCEPNLWVIFTNEPRKPMEKILYNAFANRIGTNGLLPFDETLNMSNQHVIQGWWRVGGEGSFINTDASLIAGGQLRGLWQRGIPSGSARGSRSSIIDAILVINVAKMAGANISTIADYLASVSLSISQNPDNCDSLPSILDLTSTNCSQRPAPSTLTVADIAFLKAIYSRQTPVLRTPNASEIEALMRQQLTTQR